MGAMKFVDNMESRTRQPTGAPSRRRWPRCKTLLFCILHKSAKPCCSLEMTCSVATGGRTLAAAAREERDFLD